MRGDLLLGGFGQAVPQVPAVIGLDRARQRPPDRLGAGTGPVTAHDLDAGCPRSHASSTSAFRPGRTSTRSSERQETK
jgi:hypothetical protein